MNAVQFSGSSFSHVYHLAGFAHRVPRDRAESEMFYRVNVGGSKALLSALGQMEPPPRALVIASTVAVYGVDEGSLLDEETPRLATDPYGESKREAEDMILEWGASQGIRTGVVRLPLVAGHGAPGNLGAMVRGLAQGWYLGVGSGSARRSIVLVSDVAHILPKIAEVGGIFHLTDGHHPSFAELESALASALGRHTPRRLSLRLARAGAFLGDVAQGLTGLRVPFNTSLLSKMTSTLTFSDQRARDNLGWNPTQALARIHELAI